MSSYATAVGVPSDRIPEVLHRLRTDARDETPDTASSPANPDEIRDFYDTLEFHLRHHPDVSEGRKVRVLTKIAAARVALDNGEEAPDQATLVSWRRLPVWSATVRATGHRSDEDETAPRTRSRGNARPYHKRFANFNAEAVAATDELFAARPSRMSQPEREAAFQAWVDRVSDAYGMERPTFHWDTDADMGGGGYYRPSDHSITMSPNHPSITTLIHEFRHALQHTEKGAPMVDRDVEVDARAWSLSLYYKVRPALFERLVREGRIFHITPEDLDR